MFRTIVYCSFFFFSFHTIDGQSSLWDSHFYDNDGLAPVSKVFEDTYQSKLISDPAVSSDDEIAFTALGKIWTVAEGKKKPSALNSIKKSFESHPSFSSDGSQIVYTSWSENGFGKIHLYDFESRVNKTLLITLGVFKYPCISDDGKWLAYKKELITNSDSTSTKQEGLFVMSLEDKTDPVLVSTNGDFPMFSEDSKRVHFQSGAFKFGSFVKTFESVAVDGTDKKTHFLGKYGHEYSLSPDMQWIVWQELGKIYLTKTPSGNGNIGVTADNKQLEKYNISKLPGNGFHWSSKSNAISYFIANRRYTIRLDKSNQNFNRSNQEKSAFAPSSYDIDISYPADVPEGVLAFTNARIITMNGQEVLENATIIVKQNRIVDIGFDVKVPKEAHAINCTGKTILPGLIDLDLRSNNYEYKLSHQMSWEYIESMKRGVTTKLDGGFRIYNALNNKELIRSGKLLGPRMYSAGIQVVNMDTTLFSPESYEHYKKSNLYLANAFDVLAVKAEEKPNDKNSFMVLRNKKDTSAVSADDIHLLIIKNTIGNKNNHESLAAVTIEAAKKIGMDAEIGKLQKGMLADFIVLNENPLMEISAITELSMVVMNGRVYDASTMNEIGNYRKRVSRTLTNAIYESANRAMGSACCGFQH